MPLPELVEFRIRSEIEDGQVVARVAGDVDIYTAPRLEHELNELVDRGVDEIVVDVAEVTLMDAAGLATLVRTRQRLEDRDGRLMLRSPTRCLRRTLEITGLEALLPPGRRETPGARAGGDAMPRAS